MRRIEGVVVDATLTDTRRRNCVRRCDPIRLAKRATSLPGTGTFARLGAPTGYGSGEAIRGGR